MRSGSHEALHTSYESDKNHSLRRAAVSWPRSRPLPEAMLPFRDEQLSAAVLASRCAARDQTERWTLQELIRSAAVRQCDVDVCLKNSIAVEQSHKTPAATRLRALAGPITRAPSERHQKMSG